MDTTYDENLVSIIIPVYNAEKYLEDTLGSALNQTYQDIEIIIVDDCSSDNSSKISNRYVGNDSRVKYFKNEKNSGAAYTRNRGLDLARGRYIAFLDSDDLWVNTKVERQMSILKEGSVAFVFTAYDMIDSEGNLVKEKISIKERVCYADLMTKTMISTPTVMYDRKNLGSVHFPLRRTGQDYAFWLLLLKQVDAYGIDEALVHVRRRPNSLSKNKLQNIRDVWEVQTINEGINKVSAFFHLIGYCIYTLKKRYF